MENNEIMTWEDSEIMDNVAEVGEKTGIGTGTAMLIGACGVVAVGAGIKLVKKMVANAKAKRELRQPDKEVQVEDQDVKEVASK